MKEENKKFLDIVIRYLILILVAIPGLGFFYSIFFPLTRIPVFYLLDILFNPIMVGNMIFIGEKTIEIVGACVAGSAYYLLLILNLVTSQIKTSKRIKMILFGFLAFLFINIVRIVVLSLMYINDSHFFDIAHVLFWYIGSTIFVVLIWFLQVKIFEIKTIPFYSDFKYIYEKSTFKIKKSKFAKINIKKKKFIF